MKQLTMKGTIWLSIFFGVILHSSCYKTQVTASQNGAPTYSINAYSLNFNSVSGNIKDSIITFNVNDSSAFSLCITFTLITGNPANYPITCFISGFPTGTVITPDSETFNLSYNTNFNIPITLDTGVYTFYINIRDSVNGLKTYPAHLHVTPAILPASGLVGVYSGNDPCGHFSIGAIWYTYASIVSTVPGYPHWIAINNFRGLGDSVIVYGFVTCADASDTWDGTINIPKQTIAGYTVFGSGTGYYGTQENEKPWISVYGDTIVNAGDTQTCYTQLKQ